MQKENIHKLFPLKRKFSQFCQKVVTDNNVATCVQCLGMSVPDGEYDKFDSATKCKVENESDPEEEGSLSLSNKEMSNEDESFNNVSGRQQVLDESSGDIKDAYLDNTLKIEVEFVGREEELSNASDEVLDDLLDDSLEQEMFEEEEAQEAQETTQK